jgi:hypothetical protein
MTENPYRLLAERLDALPNGFPPTPDGAELRLLAKVFTPEEAALAARLRLTKETPAQLAERLGVEKAPLRQQLKTMTRKGLIAVGAVEEGGLGYGLLPFVVGIYEMQAGRIDAELAELFEAYYRQAFGDTMRVQPQVHRVIPVQQSVRTNLAVEPYESAAAIVAKAQAWGDRLHLPHSTGPHRQAVRAPAGRVHDPERPPRRLRRLRRHPRADASGRWRRCAAPPRPGWFTR